MEVKDKLKPYLGTKTILIIDSEIDWKLLYSDIPNNYDEDMKYRHNNLCINLEHCTWANLEYFEFLDKYKTHKFLHSKDLLNTTRKYNLWKLKLTTS